VSGSSTSSAPGGAERKPPDFKQFNVPKSGKERRVDMSRQLGEAMQDFIKTRPIENEWLLPG
jgi:hypothetical protein